MSLNDDAIDRAVTQIVSRDAPADLRARVVAAIERPPSWRGRRAAWLRPPGRLAWTAGAAAIAFAAAFWLWSPAPPAVPSPAALADTRAIVEVVLAPAGPASRRNLTSRPAGAARLTDVTAATSLDPSAAGPAPPLAVVDPLVAPPPIDIAPLSESRVRVEPIAIDPLTFTPMSIAPLVAGR